MPIEFSELSKKYSDSKSAYVLLEKHAADIVTMENEIDTLQIELNRYTDEKLQTLKDILPEDDINTFITRRDAILDRIQKIRDNDIFQKRDELRTESKKIDEYMKLAESNPEFMKEVYSNIISQTATDILKYQCDKQIPQDQLDLINTLEEKAEEDPDLKEMLSIDKDKYKITIIKEAQRLGFKSSLQKEKDWSDDAIATAENSIERKGKNLRKYIEDHADELDLSTVDFEDPDSPLFFIKNYTDKTKLDTSLETITEDLKRTIKEKDEKISILNKEMELAEEDLDRLNDAPEVENIMDKIITFFSRLKPKNIINYFLGRDDLIETTTPRQQEKVVNSSGDWRDSINTPIGNDEVNKIRKTYQEKISRQNNNNNSRNNER